jgi:hypothetical protein
MFFTCQLKQAKIQQSHSGAALFTTVSWSMAGFALGPGAGYAPTPRTRVASFH